MVFFFIITLCVSIIGLVLLLAIKRFELATGRVVLAGIRPFLNRSFGAFLHLVLHFLPALAHFHFRKLWQHIVEFFERVFMQVVVLFERVLERVLTRVKEKTRTPHVRGEASSSLREVADYKRTMLRDPERVMFEE